MATCILVADSGNHRIQKFTEEGQFLAEVGIQNSGPLQFNFPEGIVFNASNKKVYVINCNRLVQVLNSDLTYSFSFGIHAGTGKGQFNRPRGIACDTAGKLYVADSDNDRVQVFTAEGKFLRMLRRRVCDSKGGDLSTQLNWLTGIAIDASDMLYVCDSDNSRICVFTSAGVFVTSFGSCGEQPGQFKWPRGIAVDDSGVVYVCDQHNNRVQVF